MVKDGVSDLRQWDKVKWWGIVNGWVTLAWSCTWVEPFLAFSTGTTSKDQRVMWPGLYRTLIEFLRIVLWHMSVHSLLRGHVIWVCEGVSEHYCGWGWRIFNFCQRNLGTLFKDWQNLGAPLWWLAQSWYPTTYIFKNTHLCILWPYFSYVRVWTKHKTVWAVMESVSSD